MSDFLKIERSDKVLTVTLNRPDIGNAFNGQLITDLTALFAGLRDEAGVHVVILAGAGKHFCAGADLTWMKTTATFGKVENAADARRLAGLFEAVDACPKPVIGRIHGAARGGGVGLVAAMDIPVASESASFALTEVRLGLAPAVISPFVVRKIGTPRARELFLTAETFGAHEAKAFGLVNHVVPDAELDAKVAERVKLVLLGGPNALAACKDLARTITRLPDDEAVVKTANLIAELRASAEAQEGMRAFLMKDQPRWTKTEAAKAES
jgi:methylglutaconyl-CoA hydratase